MQCLRAFLRALSQIITPVGLAVFAGFLALAALGRVDELLPNTAQVVLLVLFALGLVARVRRASDRQHQADRRYAKRTARHPADDVPAHRSRRCRHRDSDPSLPLGW